MLDNHIIPSSDWGILPIIFTVEGFKMPSYAFFLGLGVVAGFAYYSYQVRKNKVSNENSFLIAIAALLGGAIGAKVLKVLIDYDFVVSHTDDPYFLLSGRTILGGFIGGYIAVKIVKKIFGITDKRGNYLAPGIALGVAIGRIGCFLAGCCYGKPTGLPVGVDFGDGVLRHPTQIYESLFMLGMFFYLLRKGKKDVEPGGLFKLLMVYYFIFRFFLEFLKEEPSVWMGLDIFQLISVCAIIFLLRDNISKTIWKTRKQ